MLLDYDVAKLQQLLASFHTLTGIRIVVFNDAFAKIAEYPTHDSAFCSIIRQDPHAHAKCREQDRYACEQCKAADGIFSYTCHAGLTETVAPIRYGNLIIGYLMFGQVLHCDDAAAYWDEVARRCVGYRVDPQHLKTAYLEKQPADLKQLYAAAQILEACAGYLWLQRYVSLRESDLPQQIDEYITHNLGADLSVRTLCRRFGLSRTRLYKISGDFYGKGIEQLVRELRIAKAAELLETTSLSVSEVAPLVGYGDYNYFIKVFKRDRGQTPKQFALRAARQKAAPGGATAAGPPL